MKRKYSYGHSTQGSYSSNPISRRPNNHGPIYNKGYKQYEDNRSLSYQHSNAPLPPNSSKFTQGSVQEGSDTPYSVKSPGRASSIYKTYTSSGQPESTNTNKSSTQYNSSNLRNSDLVPQDIKHTVRRNEDTNLRQYRGVKQMTVVKNRHINTKSSLSDKPIEESIQKSSNKSDLSGNEANRLKVAPIFDQKRLALLEDDILMGIRTQLIHSMMGKSELNYLVQSVITLMQSLETKESRYVSEVKSQCLYHIDCLKTRSLKLREVLNLSEVDRSNMEIQSKSFDLEVNDCMSELKQHYKDLMDAKFIKQSWEKCETLAAKVIQIPNCKRLDKAIRIEKESCDKLDLEIANVSNQLNEKCSYAQLLINLVDQFIKE
ncbi:hypothetical protein cand_036240 [Cryptosporidium andersoni]|uniref:Uncharacterized protein n=1 Tax=Cryptosporidium andersoni TaxID=117008 RepID=A0A1J4MYE1_9CRYT|nr:hypothetical protein cand_036240 [Cryptosporidium andersoni]